MPIRRERRLFHQIDWPQLSAVVRFRRTCGRWEGCGRPALHLHQLGHVPPGVAVE
jgi:hypothetical protein